MPVHESELGDDLTARDTLHTVNGRRRFVLRIFANSASYRVIINAWLGSTTGPQQVVCMI